MTHKDHGADKLYDDIRQAIEDILIEHRPKAAEIKDIPSTYEDFERDALRYLTD